MTDQAADTGCRPAIIQQMQPSNLFNRLDCYGALTLRPIEHVDAPFFSNNSSDSVEYFSVDCERHWFPSSNNKDASHSGSDFPSMVIRPPSHTREAHEGGHEGEKDSSWFLRMAKWTNLVVWSYTRANSGSAKRVAGGCEIAELRRTESAASRLSASCSNPAISARTSSCRIPSSS